MPDRAVIVTGGGQGIGKAIAKRLLEEGERVVIAEIDEEAGRESQKEFEKLGGIHFIKADIGHEPDVIGLMEAAVRRFGKIDVLVNNAAIGCTKPIADLSLAEWESVIRVNLTGPFLCAKHAAAHLRKTAGCIVNIASTRALMSEANTEAYSASKGGILSLTHSLAISLGPHVRVNCISPGWIDVSGWVKKSARRSEVLRPEDHGQHPAGRVGRPEDIAAQVRFLISPEADFITGQNFIVDGGMTRKMIYLE